MLQKRRITVWMLLASLSITLIVVSCFTYLATRTYADGTSTLTLIRPSSSMVGSVYIINVTQSTAVGCTLLPQQDVEVPVAGNFNTNDHIVFIRFPNASCDLSGYGGKFKSVHLNGSVVQITNG